MNATKFTHLVKNLTQHFDSSDCVDLRAGSQIVIFGWRHDGFKLNIEYFDGLPSEYQKDVMQALINNSVSALEDHFKDVVPKEPDYIDMYDYNGVKRSDFY